MIDGWLQEMRALADADAADAGRRYPQIVVDGGEWAGPSAEEITARFADVRLDPAEVRWASFRLPREHIGSVPTVYGAGRRRVQERRSA